MRSTGSSASMTSSQAGLIIWLIAGQKVMMRSGMLARVVLLVVVLVRFLMRLFRLMVICIVFPGNLVIIFTVIILLNYLIRQMIF